MAKETGTRYHWLRLRAVAHPTEDVSRVLGAMRFVAGVPADEFTGILTDEPVETHHGLRQHLLEARIERSRAIRDALDRMFALDGALDRLRASADARTDDDGVFYVRVDKQAAYGEELRLTDGEDCVQLRLKLETYPATRAAALTGIQKLLERGRA